MRSIAGRLTLVCLAVVTTISNADDNADELKRLQGRFERTFRNEAGTMFRAVTEMAGDQSTVTTYDDGGQVVESHRSTFKVEKRGPVRVLSYFNVAVTAGPAKGHQDPATRSYLYRLEGDVFTEVWGLLEGDVRPPHMFHWRRIKEGQEASRKGAG
jgi:hypothetical protein